MGFGNGWCPMRNRTWQLAERVVTPLEQAEKEAKEKVEKGRLLAHAECEAALRRDHERLSQKKKAMDEEAHQEWGCETCLPLHAGETMWKSNSQQSWVSWARSGRRAKSGKPRRSWLMRQR